MATNEEYRKYLLKAREKFLRGEGVTIRDIYHIYREAAKRVHDLIAQTNGPATRARLMLLEQSLSQIIRNMNQQTLSTILAGITMAVSTGFWGPSLIAISLLSKHFARSDIEGLYTNLNERALAVFLARTRGQYGGSGSRGGGGTRGSWQGMNLSDRIWRTGENYRKAIQIIVEDGIARGVSARTLAKEVQRYLQPGVFTQHKLETRRRLGVPKNISYEAMRLARTELNNAFHEGTVVANQKTPSYKGVLWKLSGSHPIKDVCDDYARHNGNGFWPKGTEPTKPHPQCFCYVVPVHEDPMDFARRLNNWVRNPQSDRQLESWYNDTARQYLKRPAAIAR